MIPRHGENGFNGNPGGGHVDQQEAYAVLRFAAVVRAYQAENMVGQMCMRGPDLCAVDDVVVAVGLGLEFEAGKIGACAGL